MTWKRDDRWRSLICNKFDDLFLLQMRMRNNLSIPYLISCSNSNLFNQNCPTLLPSCASKTSIQNGIILYYFDKPLSELIVSSVFIQLIANRCESDFVGDYLFFIHRITLARTFNTSANIPILDRYKTRAFSRNVRMWLFTCNRINEWTSHIFIDSG